MAASETLTLIINASDKDAVAALDRVKKSLKDQETQSKSLTATTEKLKSGWVAFTAATVAVAAGLYKVMQAADGAVRAENQLNAVLKSTHHAAGLTSDEIKNMATSLQQATLYEDDAILSGQNLLLTFTKIGKDVFPQATETMLDMSSALGQDLKSSAMQLGKALNEPIQGVNALRRVGAQLSDEQEKQIKNFVKMGDVASAQKVILKELEKEFGGVAKAMVDTPLGPWIQLGNKLGDIAEDVGKGIAPAMGNLAKAFGMATADGMILSDAIKLITKTLSIAIQGIANFINLVNIFGINIKQFYNNLKSDSVTVLAEDIQNAYGEIMKAKEAAANGDERAAGLLKDYKKALDEARASSKQNAELDKAKIKISDELNKSTQSETDKLAEEAEKRKSLREQELAEIEKHNESKKEQNDKYWSDTQEKQIKEAETYLQSIQDVMNQITSIMSIAHNSEMISIDNEYRKKKKHIQATVKDETQKEKALQKLEEETTKKKRKAAREYAETQKAMALVNAIVGTAVAIVNALQMQPAILGIVMAAIVGALGAVQIGLIAAQPLPAAAEGALIKGSAAGSVIRAGEGGRNEAIIPLENQEAMEKLGLPGGGGGTTIVNNYIDYLIGGQTLPEEVAILIDRSLTKLKSNNNSTFFSGKR
jgi:hypothetical protein